MAESAAYRIIHATPDRPPGRWDRWDYELTSGRGVGCNYASRDDAEAGAIARLREIAVSYAEGRVQRVSDWQEVQHELADHSVVGPWLRELGEDALSEVQSIIREAEGRVEARGLPLGYR